VGTACEIHFEHDSSEVSPYWFCHSIFTRDCVYKKKSAQTVDMNHGLNLGDIEVIPKTEGTKKGAMGLVWLSGTVKYVHRAVEREMKTNMSFKLIDERHEDMWIDGVQLNVKEVLIYLIKHFGLE
jgi:hypothetical protein